MMIRYARRKLPYLFVFMLIIALGQVLWRVSSLSRVRYSNDSTSLVEEAINCCWRPLFDEISDDVHFLPTINDMHIAHDKFKSSGHVDVADIAAKLMRHQSQAKFLDVPEKEFPKYSVVKCRPDLGLRIPNLVHFVWLGPLEMKFHQYLSLRSAASIQQPTRLLLHLDNVTEPSGRYWERLKDEVPCLDIMRHETPSVLVGPEFKCVAHQANTIRFKVLRSMGGICLDMNAYVVNSMDPLLNYSFVVGKEEMGRYGNTVVLSEPDSPFLKIWMENYRNVEPWECNEHSTRLLARLHKSFSENEIHVEKNSLMRPNYRDGIEWMLSKNWDLANNYCVHLYENTFELELAPILALSEEDLIRLDSTFGQIVRRTLFGKFFLTEDDSETNKLTRALDCSVANNNSFAMPKTLHFIWMDESFTLLNYMSIRSAVKALIPSSVVFHIIGSEEEVEEPFSHLWVELQGEIPCMITNRLPPELAPLAASRNHSDHLKLKLLISFYYGGIVWNLQDVVVRGTFQDLENYSAIALTDPNNMEYSIFGGVKRSRFLGELLNIVDEKREVTINDTMRLSASSETSVLIGRYPFEVVARHSSTGIRRVGDGSSFGYHFVKSNNGSMEYGVWGFHLELTSEDSDHEL